MKRSILLPLLACMGLVSAPGTAGFAETTGGAPAQTKADVEAWRKNPPTLPAPRTFNMPKVDKYMLKNGLTVELVEDHRVPWTTISLGMRSGMINDQPGHNGVASMVVDMLTEGTKSRNSKQIADQIDYMGGAFSTVAGSDFTIISTSGFSRYNDKLFDLFSDVVLNPSFPEDELKLKKTNKIQELNISRSRSEFLVDERFAEVVFGKHPYSVMSPKPAEVEQITREQLTQFHNQNYLPNDTVLVVVGDFKSGEMKPLIEKSFGGWKGGTPEKRSVAEFPTQKGMMIHLVDRPESVQSSIKVGNLGIKRLDPDYYASQVTSQILGGGAIARLFLNLREKNGYTYGAYSSVSARRLGGYFSADANVRTEVTAPALKEFLSELNRMRTEPVSAKELSEAKSYMVGVFQLGLETQGGLAQRLLEGTLNELPDDYLEKYGDRVMAVTADDVERVSKRIIDSGNLVVCVVGDKSKIKSDLEKIGPLTVYDTAGGLIEKAKEQTKSMAGGD